MTRPAEKAEVAASVAGHLIGIGRILRVRRQLAVMASFCCKR